MTRCGCRAQSELMQVLFADDHRACCLESPYDFGVFGRDAIRKLPASARRPRARRIEQVLEAHRNSMQRTPPTAFHDLRFRALRVRCRLFGRHGDERVQARVQALNPRQACRGQFFRRNLLRPYELARLPQRSRRQVDGWCEWRRSIDGRGDCGGRTGATGYSEKGAAAAIRVLHSHDRSI